MSECSQTSEDLGAKLWCVKGITIFFFRKEVEENLAHECHLVAQCYDSGDPITELERFTGENFRITLIEKDGTVLFESNGDPQGMPNHLDRPEIISALEEGSGTDTRLSDTIGIVEDYYYGQGRGKGAAA